MFRFWALAILLFSGGVGATMTSTTEFLANIVPPACTVTVPAEVDIGNAAYGAIKYSPEFRVAISCGMEVHTYMVASMVRGGQVQGALIPLLTADDTDSGSIMQILQKISGTTKFPNVYPDGVTTFCAGNEKDRTCILQVKARAGSGLYGKVGAAVKFDLVYK